MASKECQSNEQKGIQFCIFIILAIKETQETFFFFGQTEINPRNIYHNKKVDEFEMDQWH